MPRVVEKEVIRPGTYWYVDESTGLPAKATFSQEEVKRMYDDGKAMLAAGLTIPVPLEHQRSLRAMTAAEKAAWNLKNNAGEVQDYIVKKVSNPDGSEVEAMFGKLLIEDPEVDKKLGGTIKWTSPWISSFTDGNGRAWNNVVTHLALTTRPRIVNQLPFPSISAAMSLAANLADKKIDEAISRGGGSLLSRAGLLQEKAGTFSPAYPMAFSLFSGVRFGPDEKLPVKAEGGGDKPAPDGDGKGAPKPKGDKPGEKPGDGLEQPQEEALVDADGDVPICEVVQDLLEVLGVNMESGTEENFEERLYKAVMEKIKSGGNMAGEPNATPTPNNAGKPANPPLIQESPPLYMSMSLEQANKITDPDKKAMALAIVELRTKQDRLEKNAVEAAKLHRQARVERLAKKVSPKVKDMLLSKLAGATFSMGENGQVHDSLHDTLTMLEESIPDLPAMLTVDQATLSVQPHPQQYQGEMSEERRQQVVAEMCKAGGLPEPKKAG